MLQSTEPDHLSLKSNCSTCHILAKLFIFLGLKVLFQKIFGIKLAYKDSVGYKLACIFLRLKCVRIVADQGHVL